MHACAQSVPRVAAAGDVAVTVGRDVYLGPTIGRPGWPARDEVLAHEQVHAAQATVGARGGPYGAPDAIERQAASWRPGSSEPLLAADPERAYGFLPWLIETLAGLTARWNDQPVPGALPGLDPRMGATGIPVTRNPAVAADFARTGGGTAVVGTPDGRIYLVQVRRGAAIDAGPVGWPEKSPVELEFVIFDEIPAQSIVGRVPVPPELPSLYGSDGALVPR